MTEQRDATTFERALAAGGVAAFAGSAGLVAYFDPANAGFMPGCPLYQTTGFACPGCGLTRGFHALFHGDVVTALDFNALLPGYALVLGFFFISMAMFAVRGRGLSLEYFRPKLLWGFLVFSLVFGVVRNIPAYPFTFLFP